MNLSAPYYPLKRFGLLPEGSLLGSPGSNQATTELACSGHHRPLLLRGLEGRAQGTREQVVRLGGALPPLPPQQLLSQTAVSSLSAQAISHPMLASFKHVKTINPESKRYMKVLEREREGSEGYVSLNFRNLEARKGYSSCTPQLGTTLSVSWSSGGHCRHTEETRRQLSQSRDLGLNSSS